MVALAGCVEGRIHTLGDLFSAFTAVGKIVDGLLPHLANSVESFDKPLRAALLAEPFPGTVAQGVILVNT